MTMSETIPVTAEQACVKAAEMFGNASCFVFHASPVQFSVGVLKAGKVRLWNEGRELQADLDQAYMLRFFGPEADLQWERQGLDGTFTGIKDDPHAATLARTYLLHGKTAEAFKGETADWTIMRAANVRPFAIPIKTARDAYVVLTASETIGRGADGNAHILNERLTGFVVKTQKELLSDER